MNARLKINMVEVTRLTRDGRLSEAMAVLRAALPRSLSSNLGGGETSNEGLKPPLSRWCPHHC